MRVAFDVRPLQYPGAMRGIGRYTAELLRALLARGVDVQILSEEGALPEEFALLPRLLASPRRLPVRQLGWLQDEFLGPLWSRFPVDLIHVTSPSDLSFGWPTRCALPVVVTVHDLFSVSPGMQGWRRLASPVYRWLLWKLRFARGLMTNSEVTATAVSSWLGRACPPLRATPLGVRPPLFDLEERRARPFLFLFPCWPRYKNVEAVVSALAPCGSEGPSLIIGGVCPESFREHVQRRAGTLPLKWTGSLTEDELGNLLHTCRGFVFPSLREGFGLTVLEAMRYGAPVACSDRPPMSEIAAEAALLFDPEDPNAVRSACLRLWSEPDLCQALSRLSVTRAEQFSWDRTARLTVGAYAEFLGSSY